MASLRPGDIEQHKLKTQIACFHLIWIVLTLSFAVYRCLFSFFFPTRSQPDPSLFWVSSTNDIYMFQTYAVIDRLSMDSASAEGGANITIYGHYFDPNNTKVKIGGKNNFVFFA